MCCRSVSVHSIPPNCITGSPNMFNQCCDFLSRLRLAPLRGKSRDTNMPEQGTSWIELFILYELMGGGDGCVYSAAQPRPNLRQALLKFKRTLTHVRLICLRQGDRDLLAPAKVQACRLKCVGVDNFVPCINSCSHIGEEYKTHLLKALVSIRSKAASTNNDIHRVTKGKMSYRGIPLWRSATFVKFHHSNFTFSEHTHTFTSTCEKPQCFKLYCRNCDAPKDVANFTLLNRGKWHPLTCLACAMTCTARFWKCKCRLPWTGCQQHAELGFLCKAPIRAKGTTQSKFLSASGTKRSNPLVPPTYKVKASKCKRGRSPLQKKEATPSAPAGSDFRTRLKRPLVHLNADVFDKSACLRRYFNMSYSTSAPVQNARKCKSATSEVSSSSVRLAVQRIRDAKANPVDQHTASSSSLVFTSTTDNQEESHQSPTNLGQTDATPPAHLGFSPCETRPNGNTNIRGKRKRPEPSIQVSRVKWGKPTPKQLNLHNVRDSNNGSSPFA